MSVQYLLVRAFDTSPPPGPGWSGDVDPHRCCERVDGGPLPDGALARLSHHPVVLRRGVPGDDLRRSSSSTPQRRPRVAGTREEVGQGVRRLVRGRRGVRHDPQLRDGPALARVDVDLWRRDGHPASRSRASRSSSRRCSSASTSTAGDGCGRRSTFARCCRSCSPACSARSASCGQRLDERYRRGSRLLPDGTVTDVDPLAAIFNDALWPQFLHMWVAAFVVTGFLSPR